MFFSSRNCQVDIDGQPIFASEASISINATIASNVHINKSAPESYVPQNGLVGTLKMSYYLTGRDYLKDYISDNTRFIKANFGGLYFNSGCLTSYSLSAEANNPVMVNSEITFFEDLLGNFTPTYSSLSHETPILNHSDTIISGTTLSNLDETLRFSYDSTMVVQPSYIDNHGLPITNRIIFGPQQSTLKILYSDFNNTLHVSGTTANVVVILRNSGGVAYESFGVTGRIVAKNINITQGNYISSEITIRQDAVSPIPIISGFTPQNGAANGSFLVTVFGSDLRNISQVLYHNTPIRYIPRGPNAAWVFPSQTPRSGKFTIVAQGGTAISSDYFVSTDAGMGEF